MVDGNTKLLVILHRLYIPSQNAQWLGNRLPLLPKIYHISLVLLMFSHRWFCPVHSTKLSTSALYPSSCTSLIHQTTAMSLENLWGWDNLVLYWKSVVYKVNRKGDSTVPCRAPVSLTTTSDRTLPMWTNYGLPFRYSVIQEIIVLLTPIICSFFPSSSGWIVLKALEKSKDVILTVPLPPSRCKWARCSR